MANAGIHHTYAWPTQRTIIQYAENKTQSEIEYINSKIMTCPKWHRINQFSIMLF